jgi:polar amino acid transport system substrate-binding protein
LFKNYSVGIVGTYTYPEIINNAIKKYPENVDTAPDELALLKKLSAGRNQAAITDPSVMLYLANQEGINDIKTDRIIMEKELVLAFRNEEDNRSRIKLLKKILLLKK